MGRSPQCTAATQHRRPTKTCTACDARILRQHEAQWSSAVKHRQASVRTCQLASLTDRQSVLQLRRGGMSLAGAVASDLSNNLTTSIRSPARSPLDAPVFVKTMLGALLTVATGRGYRSVREQSSIDGSPRPSALPEVLVCSNSAAFWRDDPPQIAARRRAHRRAHALCARTASLSYPAGASTWCSVLQAWHRQSSMYTAASISIAKLSSLLLTTNIPRAPETPGDFLLSTAQALLTGSA